MKPMKQESKVGSRLWCNAIAFETEIFAQGFRWFPAIAERRISNHRIEFELLGRVHLIQYFPVVQQRVAVVYFEFQIFYTMQQHVHAGKVVGGNVFLLSVNSPNAICTKLFTYV